MSDRIKQTTARADANKALYGGNDMKTKNQLTSRILSLVLAFVMVTGLLPMTALTAYAVTEAMDFAKKRQYIPYSSGAAQYFSIRTIFIKPSTQT